MADRPMQRRSDPLAMKIYSAFLGGLPRIVRSRSTGPQLGDDSPFHELTLRRQIRRATGSASRALDEARERLMRAKPTAPIATLPQATPLVLIGGAALRRRTMTNADRPRTAA